MLVAAAKTRGLNARWDLTFLNPADLVDLSTDKFTV